MSSTLSEGVRVPDIGSTSWGADVNFNWGLLNTALANISGNVKVNVANTWTAPQTFTETISGSIDGIAARAVGDEDGTNIKTALASKAADNSVVHLAGAETIPGNKTFTGTTVVNLITTLDAIYNKSGASSLVKGTIPSDTAYYGMEYARNSANETCYMWRGQIDTSGSNCLRFYVYPWVSGASKYFQFIVNSDASSAKFQVAGTEVSPIISADTDLGTPIRKWKTLNGINPGALSFPLTGTTANTDYIDVSGSIDLTTTSIQNLTAPATGWLCLSFSYNKITSCQLSAGNYRTQTGPLGTSGYVGCVVPVTAGQTVNIRVDATALHSARLYLCQGNV